jgi:pimeloyl-ACP methyl ester carboxylesterase
MADTQFADVNGIRIAYERTGQGYPLLLLHGYPQTRRMWRLVTPALSQRFDVVAMDMRGYGESARPPGEENYDKRTMAADAVALARHLGWDKFLLAGHDRGARASRRLAADHPDAISGALLLDIMPMEWMYEHGRGNWHWYFQLQRGLADRLISLAPRTYAAHFFSRSRQALDPEAVEHYVESFSAPGGVEATLGDYRTAYDVDRPRWEAEVAQGQRIRVPLYVIWGGSGGLTNYPILDVWRSVANDVRGEAVPESAHWIPEEQPEAVVGHFLRFADELGLP